VRAVTPRVVMRLHMGSPAARPGVPHGTHYEQGVSRCLVVTHAIAAAVT
jgi:hypothetical protein